jgi:hypothetical protein
MWEDNHEKGDESGADCRKPFSWLIDPKKSMGTFAELYDMRWFM